ncbi:MAG: molybdopterin synthase sulfur carrier subunit [Chitinophagales bacterium]|nr:molybdopterin synthase sulfur carrier subunit [Chitinophagales bacterium]
MARIIIPTPLRKFTKDESTFFSSKKNVLEAIEELSSFYPEIKNNLFDEDNKLRSFVKVFVGDKDYNSLQEKDIELQDDTVVSIIPAIAGGTGK